MNKIKSPPLSLLFPQKGSLVSFTVVLALLYAIHDIRMYKRFCFQRSDAQEWFTTTPLERSNRVYQCHTLFFRIVYDT